MARFVYFSQDRVHTWRDEHHAVLSVACPIIKDVGLGEHPRGSAIPEVRRGEMRGVADVDLLEASAAERPYPANKSKPVGVRSRAQCTIRFGLRTWPIRINDTNGRAGANGRPVSAKGRRMRTAVAHPENAHRIAFPDWTLKLDPELGMCTLVFRDWTLNRDPILSGP